ncbi:uncharacterized protein LOC130738081 isoform X3 [Lotus japonicus]|uniref:uncharacterized protein LOC130738081 isoform X3 n=2 Tax=Lotus japonicus TaxID=34305 RepID=UPI002589529B|nr:uncharacterized protein LOC130738081 isoform X3 [Lotus japonicus]
MKLVKGILRTLVLIKTMLAKNGHRTIMEEFNLPYRTFNNMEFKPSIPHLLQRVASLRSPPAIVGAAAWPATKLPSTWSRPREEVIKLNFNASLSPSKFSGLGLIARNHKGVVMAAAALYHLAAPSPLLAEVGFPHQRGKLRAGSCHCGRRFLHPLLVPIKSVPLHDEEMP